MVSVEPCLIDVDNLLVSQARAATDTNARLTLPLARDGPGVNVQRGRSYRAPEVVSPVRLPAKKVD